MNNYEFEAATTYIKAPSNEKQNDSIKSTATEIQPRMWVGTFARHSIGLIKTDPGRGCAEKLQLAVEVFPNAKYVVAVGVCYGFPEKTKYGDVLISQSIINLGDVRLGDVVKQRGERTQMKEEIRAIFCDSPNRPEGFVVSKHEKDQRTARHLVGNIVSTTQLIADSTIRDKIYAAVNEDANGGEMEGGELVIFQNRQTKKGKNISVIIIKAVVDFGDNRKNKSWQFISAKAAFHYVHCKLEIREPGMCVYMIIH